MNNPFSASNLNKITQDFYRLTGLKWGFHRGGGSSRNSIHLRPLSLVTGDDYRVGFQILHIDGDTFAGLSVIHSRNTARTFAAHLADQMFQPACDELAAFFHRHRARKWEYEFNGDLFRLYAHERVVVRFSNVPALHGTKESEGTLPRSVLNELTQARHWQKLHDFYPRSRFTTFRDPDQELSNAGSHLVLLERTSRLSALVLWERWKYCLGAMTFHARSLTDSRYDPEWTSTIHLWNQMKEFYGGKRGPCFVKGCRGNHFHLDHVIEKQDVPPNHRNKRIYDSPSNIAILCSKCHSIKSRSRRAGKVWTYTVKGRRHFLGEFELDPKRIKHDLKTLPVPKRLA
jgi:hypothetical protein